MDVIFRHTAYNAQAQPRHRQRIQEIVADGLRLLSEI